MISLFAIQCIFLITKYRCMSHYTQCTAHSVVISNIYVLIQIDLFMMLPTIIKSHTCCTFNISRAAPLFSRCHYHLFLLSLSTSSNVHLMSNADSLFPFHFFLSFLFGALFSFDFYHFSFQCIKCFNHRLVYTLWILTTKFSERYELLLILMPLLYCKSKLIGSVRCTICFSFSYHFTKKFIVIFTFNAI